MEDGGRGGKEYYLSGCCSIGCVYNFGSVIRIYYNGRGVFWRGVIWWFWKVARRLGIYFEGRIDRIYR